MSTFLSETATPLRPDLAPRRSQGLRRWGSVLVAALLLRVATVLVFPDAQLHGDQLSYFQGASEIARGLPYSGTRGPAYSAFLATCAFIIPGDPILAMRLGNAVLGTLLVAILGALGTTLFSRRIGWIAALWVAVHPRHATFALYLFSEHLYVPCVFAGLLACARGMRGGGAWPWIAAGAAMGLGALTREALLYFLPALLAAAFLGASHPWRRTARHTALLVAAALLTVAPWTLRNALTHGAFVPVGLSSGSTLFEGNYPAENLYRVRQERDRLHARFLREGQGSLLEVDRRFRELAWEIIASRQPTWLPEKLASNGPELLQPDTTRPELWWFVADDLRVRLRRAWSLLFVPVHLATLLLGALGLAHWRLRDRQVLPLAFLLFSLAVHIVAFAGLSRYQLPYEVVMILAASVAVVKGFPRGARLALALTLMSLVVISQIPVRDRWTAPYRSALDYRLLPPDGLPDGPTPNAPDGRDSGSSSR